MKQLNIAVIIIVTLIIPLISQEKDTLLENPLSKNAGRIVEAEKKGALQSESGDYHFKAPRLMRFAPDGSFFVRDEKQLARFSPEGRFLKNYFKSGNNAGEGEVIRDYWPEKDILHVFFSRPSKWVRFDYQGKCLGETPLRMQGLWRIIGPVGDRFAILFTRIDFSSVKTGPDNQFWSLYYLDDKGELSAAAIEFRVPVFFNVNRLKGKTTVGWNFRAYLDTAYINEREVFICHEAKHALIRFDPLKQETLFRLHRDFPSVKYIRSKNEKNQTNEIRIPDPDFFTDIQALFFDGQEIWVFTSKIDTEKGILVDILHPDGLYLDSFYLNIKGLKSLHDFHFLGIKKTLLYLFSPSREGKGNIEIFSVKR